MVQHDGRNAALAVLLGVVIAWGLAGWVVAPELWPEARERLLVHRVAPVVIWPVLVVWLWCELVFCGGEGKRGRRGGQGRGR